MALVTVTPVSTLPTPPSTASPSDFDARGDAFLGALPTFQSQVNVVASQTNENATWAQTKATEAQNSANNAQTSASNAAASATSAAQANGAAAQWAVTNAYSTIGTVVWSPINAQSYRKITSTTIAANTGSDPSIDSVNWKMLGASIPDFILIQAGVI